MKKTVLLYNFSEDELPKVRRVLLPLKFTVKNVEPESADLPVGYLAGLTDEGLPVEEKAEKAGKLLVMGGFLNSDIDKLLAAMRKTGFSKDVLKAVITPTNASWSGAQLYSEILREHEVMTGKKPGKE